MRGSIGTQMGSNSRMSAVKRSLPALIKAKDILKAVERGICDQGKTVMEICRCAVESPSLLNERQKRIIWSVWVDLAERGVLHGIRTSNRRLRDGRETEE